MYVCICNAITESQVRASVDAGASTLEDLQLDTGVASSCGTCAEAAAGYLPGNCPMKDAGPDVDPASVVPPPDCVPVRWVSRAPHSYRDAA